MNVSVVTKSHSANSEGKFKENIKVTYLTQDSLTKEPNYLRLAAKIISYFVITCRSLHDTWNLDKQTEKMNIDDEEFGLLHASLNKSNLHLPACLRIGTNEFFVGYLERPSNVLE